MAITSGHLAGVQGGIRGHSAGDIFPYIIMLKGPLNNIKYHVIGNGYKIDDWPFATYAEAFSFAEASSGYDILLARQLLKAG